MLSPVLGRGCIRSCSACAPVVARAGVALADEKLALLPWLSWPPVALCGRMLDVDELLDELESELERLDEKLARLPPLDDLELLLELRELDELELWEPLLDLLPELAPEPLLGLIPPRGMVFLSPLCLCLGRGCEIRTRTRFRAATFEAAVSANSTKPPCDGMFPLADSLRRVVDFVSRMRCLPAII